MSHFIVFKRLSILVKLDMVGFLGAGHNIKICMGFENKVCETFHRENPSLRVWQGSCCPAEVGIKIGWFSGAVVTHFMESQRTHSNTNFEARWLMLSILVTHFMDVGHGALQHMRAIL